ncbi:transmembrane protein 145-like [Venturia canescens]|uniref:transmembrane protein 145-like n=1 Tax=Venturia canescens TaxID=32260 RepID=UPI001C9BE429|nr:transmembrane protein 145-like [Venturia canescens]
MFRICKILCVAYVLSERYVDGKILQGQLVTQNNWAFLARFCFLSEKGKFRFDFRIAGDIHEESRVNLLLYFDAANQWPSIYPSNRSCEEKTSILSPEYGQIVPLFMSDVTQQFSGCVPKSELENGTKARCTSYREFKSSRPRWWFIALADCSSRLGLNVTYWISLTNASPESFWRHHFSADEFYILPELIAVECVYVILLACSIYTAIQLKLRRLLHSSYKIFMLSLICQLIGVSCEIYSMVCLGLTGIEAKRSSVIGGILESYSETLYTVLMLLLALGYTVTKSELTRRQIFWLFIFITTSVIFQLSMFVYESQVFDPGLVLYIYESPPGYALLMLKLSAWLVFVSCCYRTSRKTTTKYRFYASLLSLGSAWFLFHPIMVLAITLLVDQWVRESVVKGCSLWVVMLGHALFLYVTRPSMNNERFPFHIRTCQVVPAMGTGQNHSYEPRPRTRTRTAVSVFTLTPFAVSNTAGAR